MKEPMKEIAPIDELLGQAECLHCNERQQLPGRHFCSVECRALFTKTMPFVLACFGCDAGEGELRSIDEAHAAGWRNMQPCPDGFWWNYIGDCPECAALDAAHWTGRPDHFVAAMEAVNRDVGGESGGAGA